MPKSRQVEPDAQGSEAHGPGDAERWQIKHRKHELNGDDLKQRWYHWNLLLSFFFISKFNIGLQYYRATFVVHNCMTRAYTTVVATTMRHPYRPRPMHYAQDLRSTKHKRISQV